MESLTSELNVLNTDETLSQEGKNSANESVVPTAGSTVGVCPNLIEKAKTDLKEILAIPGMIEPDRGNLNDPAIKWRSTKPDYTLANIAYLKGKTQFHKVGSLELLVENLVKTWEMEASHKVDLNQWTTVNQAEYHIQGNGGRIFTLEENLVKGNYNVLMDNVDKSVYDAKKETFESSHKVFRSAFPDGFPWEVLEVFSPPPLVAFSWRHWANFTGEFEGHKGNGQVIEMVGFLLATVTPNLKITDLKVFFKPEKFFEALKSMQ